MNLPTSYLEKFKPETARAGPKVDFEFQAIGLELQPYYGKKIWSLFYKPGMTEDKVRRAHEIAKKRGVMKYGYLIGVLKNLK